MRDLKVHENSIIKKGINRVDTLFRSTLQLNFKKKKQHHVTTFDHFCVGSVRKKHTLKYVVLEVKKKLYGKNKSFVHLHFFRIFSYLLLSSFSPSLLLHVVVVVHRVVVVRVLSRRPGGPAADDPGLLVHDGPADGAVPGPPLRGRLHGLRRAPAGAVVEHHQDGPQGDLARTRKKARRDF